MRAVRGIFMKYALIGCGRISGNHIDAALKNGLDVVALCDIIEEKAAAKRISSGLPSKTPIYTDYKKMIEAEKPELVSIAAISGVHAEIAVYCANHGVNFIVEKPMAMSIKDADEVIAAVEKNGVTASVSHQNRFNIAVQQLKNAVDEGRFGKISNAAVNIRWHRGEDYYKSDDWRGKWLLDGGTLMNQCIHGMDLLRWLLGNDITEVYGVTKRSFHPYIEGEDLGVAAVKFASGAVATVEGTTNAFEDFEETLTVIGESGTVRLGGMAANTVNVWKFADSRNEDNALSDFEEKAKNVYGNGHASLFLDVIKAINEKRAPYVDVYAGKRAVEFVLAVYKSSLVGAPVKLPLEDFSTEQMIGFFENGK